MLTRFLNVCTLAQIVAKNKKQVQEVSCFWDKREENAHARSRGKKFEIGPQDLANNWCVRAVSGSFLEL
jgi:hypothetical protein